MIPRKKTKPLRYANLNAWVAVLSLIAKKSGTNPNQARNSKLNFGKDRISKNAERMGSKVFLTRDGIICRNKGMEFGGRGRIKNSVCSVLRCFR